MAKISHQRKQELIKVKLAQIMRRASNNPAFENVTIVDVKLSPDSSTALVFYAVFSSTYQPDEITQALKQASGFFQGRLARTLKTRNTPKLNFVYDRGFDHTDKVNVILQNLQPEIDQKFE